MSFRRNVYSFTVKLNGKCFSHPCFAPLTTKGQRKRQQKQFKWNYSGQILRLRQDGFSVSAIARLTAISRPTVIKYLCRLEVQRGEQISLNEEQFATASYNHDNAPHGGKRYKYLVLHQFRFLG
jgi:hypothetical protein